MREVVPASGAAKKDRAKRLPDYLRRFIAGAKSRGVSNEQIEAVWEMILSFDGYSFCKPHSASYARVSFQAAYLKTHFPAEFMAAVISNQGGFHSTAAYVSEIRRLGVRVLPPDVNQPSSSRYELSPYAPPMPSESHHAIGKKACLEYAPDKFGGTKDGRASRA